MVRMGHWAAAAALAMATPVVAQQAAPTPAIPGADAAAELALVLGTNQNRMTVPVSIGQQGPWPFIIDTGAERTVVSRQLAQSLGLAAGPPLHIVAMTGPATVPSAVVPALGISRLSQPTITAPALEAVHIGAAGMLGIDSLQGHRVDIDFDRAAMTVAPSRRRPVAAGAHGDEVVVVARSRMGQLIVTDAMWRGRRVAVVIDTGSALTVGNPPLLALVAAHAKAVGRAEAISATGGTLTADSFALDELTIGGIGLANVPVAIADAAPFRRFGLEKRPALMLGMDTLRLFRRVRIDFANRDIALTLPRGLGERIGL